MATHENALVTRRERAARLHGIYAIVNEGDGDVLAIADACIAAGIRILQYRAKAGIIPEHVRVMRERTRRAGALLIMNDDWHAALAFDCDGVHLGPDDAGFVDVAPIRAAFPEGLIGLSCGTVAEAQAAQRCDVDYIGVGAVYATGSKSDAGEPIGVEGLRRVAAATSFPVAAIGGITGARLAEIRETGVAMAAVISAIAGAPQPSAAAAQLAHIWNAADA